MRRITQLHVMLGSSVCKKLQSTSGETIVETLASILISALALMLLVATISASVNIVTSSRDHMEAHYNSETELVNSTAEAGTTGTVTTAVPIEGTMRNISVNVYGNETSNMYLYKKVVAP